MRSDFSTLSSTLAKDFELKLNNVAAGLFNEIV